MASLKHVYGRLRRTPCFHVFAGSCLAGKDLVMRRLAQPTLYLRESAQGIRHFPAGDWKGDICRPISPLMVPTRSILWWFCGIAGVFCPAPRAVSGTEFRPDPVHVLPAPASASSGLPGPGEMAVSITSGAAWRKTGTASGSTDTSWITRRPCARPGRSCSPYFRDHWANPRESGDGYQGSSAPAALVDYPFGWDVLQRIALESCARCVDTGEFPGCAEWGAEWPAQGPRTRSGALTGNADLK